MREFEEVKKEIKKSELINKIISDSSEMNLENWIKDQESKKRIDLMSTIIFDSLTEIELEIILFFSEHSKGEEKIIILSKQISFKSTFGNILYEIILSGKPNSVYPFKLLFKGYYIEEYLAFRYNKEDPNIDMEFVKKFENSWCNEKYINSSFKKVLYHFIEEFDENPLQLPVDPKELLSYRNSSVDTRLLSYFRIELYNCINYSSELSKDIKKIIINKEVEKLYIIIQTINRLSIRLLDKTTNFDISKLYKISKKDTRKKFIMEDKDFKYFLSGLEDLSNIFKIKEDFISFLIKFINYFIIKLPENERISK